MSFKNALSSLHSYLRLKPLSRIFSKETMNVLAWTPHLSKVKSSLLFGSLFGLGYSLAGPDFPLVDALFYGSLLSFFVPIYGDISPSWYSHLKKKGISVKKKIKKPLLEEMLVPSVSLGLATAISAYALRDYIPDALQYIQNHSGSLASVFSKDFVSKNSTLVGNFLYSFPLMYYGSSVFIHSSISTLFTLGKNKKSLFKSTKLAYRDYDESSFEGYRKLLRHNDLSIDYLSLLFDKEPKEKILGVFVDELFKRESITPSNFNVDYQRRIMMYYDLGAKNPSWQLFLRASLGKFEPELIDYYADNAIVEAREEKDMSSLSIFALYKERIGQSETASALFDELAQLTEDLPLEECLFGHGATEGTAILSSSKSFADATSYVFVRKSAPAEKKNSLEEEYLLTKAQFSSLPLGDKLSVPEVFSFGSSKDTSSYHYTMKQIWLPTLLETTKTILEKQGSSAYYKIRDLYKVFFHRAESLYDALNKQDVVEIPQLDLIAKYLQDKRIQSDPRYDAGLLNEVIQVVLSLGAKSSVPLLDYHPENILTDYSFGDSPFDAEIVRLDSANKGRSTKVFDLINLLHYSPHHYSALGFDTLEQELLGDASSLSSFDDQLFLLSAVLRLKQESWLSTGDSTYFSSSSFSRSELLSHTISCFSAYVKKTENPYLREFLNANIEQSKKLL